MATAALKIRGLSAVSRGRCAPRGSEGGASSSSRRRSSSRKNKAERAGGVAPPAATRQSSDAGGAVDERLAKVRTRLADSLGQVTVSVQATQEATNRLRAQTEGKVNGEGLSALSAALQASEQCAEHSEEAHCVVGHPGSECCTEHLTHYDEASGVATVRFTTTVRAVDDPEHPHKDLSAADSVTLALQTLSETVAVASHERDRVAGVAGGLRVRHAELRAVMVAGKIVQAAPTEPPSQFGHISYQVRLKDRYTGRVVRTLFKPRVYGDAEGWHRAPIEWVAYELNLMLGLDLVPPVALRNDVDVDGKHFDEGAFIYFVEGARVLEEVPEAEWGVDKERLLSDTRILDVLLQNSDRHMGHFMHAPHWDGGVPGPFLVDHAAGFRQDAYVSLEHENAFRTGPVTRIAASTYLRLRFLDSQSLTDAFAGVLSGRELRALVHRRNQILAYFDALVAERGIDSVVIDG